MMIDDVDVGLAFRGLFLNARSILFPVFDPHMQRGETNASNTKYIPPELILFRSCSLRSCSFIVKRTCSTFELVC